MAKRRSVNSASRAGGLSQALQVRLECLALAVERISPQSSAATIIDDAAAFENYALKGIAPSEQVS